MERKRPNRTLVGLLTLGIAASAPLATADTSLVNWQPPLALENPYLVPPKPEPVAQVVPEPAVQSPPAPPVERTWPLAGVRGRVIDADAPTIYRLPQVGPATSDAPPPIVASDDRAISIEQPASRAAHPLNMARSTRLDFGAGASQHDTSRPVDGSRVVDSLPSVLPPMPPSPSTARPAPVPAQTASAPASDEPLQSMQTSPTTDSPSVVSQFPRPRPSGATTPIADDETADSERSSVFGPPPSLPQRHSYGVGPDDVFPYTPTAAELSLQLLPAVQHGYALAQRGAMFAAQTEFIQVLRRIAQARDAELGTDAHSQALAAGLRALDEANDFVPDGIQLEADLDVWIVASSHRTPVLRNHPAEVLPHEAVALYHGYAKRKLGEAVAGEQAGSMVLYGLGKVYARQAERGAGDQQAIRNAMTMYLAALAASPDNHLAANELGVLLVRNGRAAEAVAHFQRTIDHAPSATAYHNLAVAQRKLGLHGPAAANEKEANRLAAWERASGVVSRRAGVEWVSPADMARVAQAPAGN